MNPMELKAAIASPPALLVLIGSVVLFAKTYSMAAFLQLVGAGCLVLVVLAHICEAFGFLPWMGWGVADSVGHYIDLGSAILALTLFPIGFVWLALQKKDP
jgi:hypothetical protein